MRAPRWGDLDEYVLALLGPEDDALRDVRTASATAGLPPHEVSPLQGRLLQLLVRAAGAGAILEVGTLGGYSTVWLAHGLREGGRVVTVEADGGYARIARTNLERAGVSHLVELVVGRSRDVLPRLATDGAGPFDLVFIDGDKAELPGDFAGALALSRPGTLVVADNVVRGGDLLDETSDDARVRGARGFLEALGAEPRVTATVIQTVGAKGYDGFAVAVVG